MPHMQVDREMWLIVPFLIGSMASLGLVDSTVIPGIDLAMVLHDFTGAGELTLGRAISVGALVAIVVNRDVPMMQRIKAWSGIEAWVVYATVGMILAPPLVPTIESFLSATPAAYFALLVQAFGFAIVSWLN